jgi:N-acetyl-alpha-D-muramate 1-phosphate uridylyltransferase
MADTPKKAFVLAAGRGERMRPLTDNCPKPLLYVGGRTMLDRALDALEEAGVEEVVVNLHYLPEMIEEHLKTRKSPKITFSREDALLETGGGVKKALAFFGDEPFFVLNADVIWTDGPTGSTLKQMAKAWDSAKMDLMLLLHTTKDLPSYNGKGDYYLADGSSQPVFKARAEEPANFIFAGPRIVHPRLLKDAPEGAFSFLELFHKAEAAGKLFAHRHDGEWHHVGNPEAFEETNRLLTAQAKKRAP